MLSLYKQTQERIGEIPEVGWVRLNWSVKWEPAFAAHPETLEWFYRMFFIVRIMYKRLELFEVNNHLKIIQEESRRETELVKIDFLMSVKNAETRFK